MVEQQTEFFRMPKGIEVAIPASIDKLTSYVLREQGDWFEDELDFCRQVLQAGDGVVDIGANHGVYALTAAACVGPTGRVWAFEPTSALAALLESSRIKNQFSHLTIVRAALSGRSGSAQLHLSENGELNSLEYVNGLHSETESVEVTTLDESARALDIRDLAFLKLDAEGHEESIISAGRETLERTSPLVMFERKHGDVVNVGVVEALRKLGYGIGRLVPGPKIVTPFVAEAPVDPYQLNLFAFKPDRATSLQSRGFLVTGTSRMAPNADTSPWRTWIAQHPFAQLLARQWDRGGRSRKGWERNLAALSEWVRSQDATRPAAERFAHLDNAVDLALQALDAYPSPTRMLTAARLAFEFGERSAGVKLLRMCLDPAGAAGSEFALDEPFLPPSPRFDALDPAGRLEAWCVAATLEAFEQQRAFSSYFTGTSAFGLLARLERLGFLSGPMASRLTLLRRRFPQGAAV